MYIKNLSKHPTVTIAIPTFNEENHIQDVLESFHKNSYELITQILVADGRSTDRTREIINNFNKKDSRVQLIDNPEKTQVYAFNYMLNAADGELFMLAGAHAEYSLDYVKRCVEAIKNTEALNVGGPTRLAAKSTVQAGILVAWYSFLGNGGAKHRFPKYSGYVDTLFPGFYVTDVLKKIGGFNEQNLTNQDSEINLRLSKLKSNAHYLSKEIEVYYYPRDSYIKLLKQYIRYGRGRCITTFRHPLRSPVRGYISFVTGWLILVVLYLIRDVTSTISLIAITILILLGLISIDINRTIQKMKKEIGYSFWRGDNKNPPSNFSIFILGAFAVILMHLGMWIGFSYQIVKNLLTFSNRW